MRKQLSVTLACFLLSSATALAQSWKSYENTAKGKIARWYLSNLPGKARLLCVK